MTTTFARRNDPVTSWEAAASISKQAQACAQSAVLAVLRDAGPSTVDHIHRVVTSFGATWDKSCTRTACTELSREGTARVFDNNGRSDKGRPCQRWVATPVQDTLLSWRDL